ncbi:unnamed protein product [Rangifer tarandus platyrhynchus]|uniref:Uncharacterized protein n=1 Tax=Rangifer tarandus platyrhynchus TaxID=3082113 RepID=A0AC59Z8X9_RANTA
MISNPVAQEIREERIEELIDTMSGSLALPLSITVDKPVLPLSKAGRESTCSVGDLGSIPGLGRFPGEGNGYLLQEEDLVIANTCLDRKVIPNLRLPEIDNWLNAAIECLEYFPGQLIVTVGQELVQHRNEQTKLNTQKKLLFDVIIKYYNQEFSCLLTDECIGIYSGIFELLVKRCLNFTLEATLLYLRLLSNVREELRWLLTFMAIASEANANKLQKKFDNKMVVLKTLAKAVLQSKSLLKVQAGQLVLFLLELHYELFKTPVTLLDLVSKKLK